jgi:adenine-specific DNA-methyltransferase
VKDGQDASLTREVMQIKAFRDTWTLGIHSYLTYLRDRLLLCRDLLADSGSIFVQIGDENLHHVRELMDEVFGRENFVSLITLRKAAPLAVEGLSGTADYLIWYAKDKARYKYRELFVEKEFGEETRYAWIEDEKGKRKRVSQYGEIPANARYFVAEAVQKVRWGSS